MICHPRIQPRVETLLGIPEPTVPFDMMVLGLPGANPRPKLLRPIEKMVHLNDCGPEDFRKDEEVNRFAEKTKAWAIGTHRCEYRDW